MKAIIICTEPFPVGMAATKRIICYAKALIEGGIRTEVVIFTRTERKGCVRNAERVGTFEGIPFRYTGPSTVKPSHKIPRLLSRWADRRRLKSYLRSRLCKGDAVIAYVNSDTDYMVEIADLVHKAGAKFVRELCEIPFFGKDENALNDILVRLFPLYDGFLCISEALSEVALKHKNPKAGILKVPILVDYSQIAGRDESCAAKIPYLFHCGTLSESKDGILGMLASYAIASQRLEFPTEMVIAGELKDSPDKEKIERLIAENDLSGRVRFVGYQSGENLKRYLLGATAAVINKTDNPQNHYGFSTKLADYLASGTLVIMSEVGEAMNWLENGKTAVVVPPNDTQAMALAIEVAFTDTAATRRIALAGSELCRAQFDWHAHSGRLATFLESLTIYPFYHCK